jgi:arsenite-transporting ATPase
MTEKVIKVFAGKGGVGKTTCASATALHCANEGLRTLVISTDPTPSLADIYEARSGKENRITDCLCLHEIGVPEIKQMWDTRFGREVYEVFSSFVAIDYPAFVDFMTSILPGLGDEFMVDYIRGLSQRNEWDAIIWDTAPLGQTLALLETPALLRRHLRMAPRIYSRLKVGAKSREPVLEILKRWERLSAENMSFLRKDVEFVIVTIAEALAVNQLQGVRTEMERYGLKLSHLVINNLVSPDGSPFLAQRAEQQQMYVKRICEIAEGLSVVKVPLFATEIKGLTRLGEVERCLFAHESS